jgi:hypothetical protein
MEHLGAGVARISSAGSAARSRGKGTGLGGYRTSWPLFSLT